MTVNLVATRYFGPGPLARSYQASRDMHLMTWHAIVQQARLDDLYRRGDGHTPMLDFSLPRPVLVEYVYEDDE